MKDKMSCPRVTRSSAHPCIPSWARRPSLLPLLTGLAALCLYLLTAAPGIVAFYDDSLEFQLVGPTFGIAHPTGYPLYTLLGGLWSRLLFPFGIWAWRMNLFSAVAGAGAVALLSLLARRLAGHSNWAGLAAALSFALSPVWWRQTTVAEVYALHGCLVAAILYAAISLPGSGGQPDPTARPALLFLLLGLALAHHRTTLLLLPGLALYLLWRAPAWLRPQKAWIGWAMAFALPLLLYLYLPLRAAMGVQDLEGHYVQSWQGFWDHVLARRYTGFLAANPLALDRSAAGWLPLLRAQVGWLGLILGAAGLAGGLLDRSRRPEWALVATTFTLNLLFAASYRVTDAEVFAIPAFLCLAAGIGRGVALGQRAHPLAAHVAPPLLLLALLALPTGRGPAVDRSDDWAVHNLAMAMAQVEVPPGSRVVGLRGQITALLYAQQAEGLMADAVPVALNDPEARRAFVVAAVAAGYPVYLTQELAGIEEQYSFSGVGPLVRVWPRNEAEAGAPSVYQEELLAEGGLRLVGYDLDLLAQPGDPVLRVAFYWQPTRPLARRFKLSLRLLDHLGNVTVQEDRFPLRQVAPTTAWVPGEIVRDVHYLPYDPRAADFTVILYDAETVAEAGRLHIKLPAHLLPHSEQAGSFVN